MDAASRTALSRQLASQMFERAWQLREALPAQASMPTKPTDGLVASMNLYARQLRAYNEIAIARDEAEFLVSVLGVSCERLVPREEGIAEWIEDLKREMENLSMAKTADDLPSSLGKLGQPIRIASTVWRDSVERALYKWIEMRIAVERNAVQARRQAEKAHATASAPCRVRWSRVKPRILTF